MAASSDPCTEEALSSDVGWAASKQAEEPIILFILESRTDVPCKADILNICKVSGGATGKGSPRRCRFLPNVIASKGSNITDELQVFSIQKILCRDCLHYYSPWAGDDPFSLCRAPGKPSDGRGDDWEPGDMR